MKAKLLIEVKAEGVDDSVIVAWLEMDGERGRIKTDIQIDMPSVYAPSYLAEVTASWIVQAVNRGAKLNVSWNTLYHKIQAEIEDDGEHGILDELYLFLAAFREQMAAAKLLVKEE